MNKRIALFAVLIVALIGVAVAGVVVLRKQNKAEAEKLVEQSTYYQYDEASVAAITSLKTQATMSVEQVYQYDKVAFDLVKKYKLPPTKASRIYAHLATAQGDAAALSFNANQQYKGSLAPVSEAIICVFFEDDCKKSQADEYSEELASLVLEQAQKRLAADAVSTKYYTINPDNATWNNANPATPEAGLWKPWHLASVVDFRAPEPPKYGSAQDEAQLAAVKTALANITPEQKQAAIFWAGSAGTETPAGIWLNLANEYAQKHNESLPQVLEVRATLNRSIADAFIACWNTKFTYWTMRPNMKDPSIQTVIPTPNFPSYTSGHATISAAASTILSDYYPEDSEHWMQLGYQARDSRLWAGIHYPIDNEQGFAMGQRIAQYILQHSKNAAVAQN